MAWTSPIVDDLDGALPLVQGRLEDAQALLEEALDLSLAARSTQAASPAQRSPRSDRD